MSNAEPILTLEPIAGYPFTVNKLSGGRVQVCYGADKQTADNYDDAAQKIGYAIMHALACEGKLPKGFTI